MKDGLLIVATLALRLAFALLTRRLTWHTWTDRRKQRRHDVWTPGERHAVRVALGRRHPPRPPHDP